MKSFKIIKSGMMLLGLVLIAFSIANYFLDGVLDPTGFILGLGVTKASFAFTDMLFEDEPENMGGFGSIAYIAVTRDIDVFPTIPSSPSTNEEASTMVGDFTMKTDKSFIQVYSTMGTAGVTAESQGEADAKSFRIKGELFYPGTGQDPLALARKLNNAHGVVIMVDPNTGKRNCWGTKDLYVTFSASCNFGKAAADRRGVTITFETDSFIPAWIYEGEIPLSGSTLPAVS